MPNARQKLISNALHKCSNADSCDLGTRMCSKSNQIGITDMSTNMKLNNADVMNELATLGRVDMRERRGGSEVSHDFKQFEMKKNEVNKELIKLQ